MNINETQALKWLVVGIGSATTLMAASTWFMLYRLRERVRHDRALREQQKRRQNDAAPGADVERHSMAGVG